jgi:hypothetical protein
LTHQRASCISIEPIGFVPMFNDFPQPLLQPHMLGDLLLTNRVVMAPLTRGRAHNPWHVPNEQRPEGYYGATAFGYTDYPFLTAKDLHAGTEGASLSRLCPASCDTFKILQSRPATKTGQNNLTNTSTHKEQK